MGPWKLLQKLIISREIYCAISLGQKPFLGNYYRTFNLYDRILFESGSGWHGGQEAGGCLPVARKGRLFMGG